MGLLYQFSADQQDSEHFILQDGAQPLLTLRSFGLPPLFWLYGLLFNGALLFLSIPIYGPLKKLWGYQDLLSRSIVLSLSVILLALPVIVIAFFFYEKNIQISSQQLTIRHKLFFFPVWSLRVKLQPQMQWRIHNMDDGPNMARRGGQQELRAFYNKGYYQLYLHSPKQAPIFIDRHSNKADLTKIAQVLEHFSSVPVAP